MNKGSYILVIRLDRDRILYFGVKKARFKKGFYCYVGSALNSLDKRIERHLKKEKVKHWHIDYLLEHAEIVHVVKLPSAGRTECKVSEEVRKKSLGEIKGFGCTDCNCSSHLYYFGDRFPEVISKN